MRPFLLAIFFLICTNLSFAGNQKANARLYGNYLKGLFCLAKGEYAQGLKELERTRKKDPTSIYTRLKLATVYIRLGKMEAAEAVLREAKKIDPDNLDVSLALIFVYSYAKEDVKLEEEYKLFLQKAHQAKPDSTDIAEYLAQFHFYKNNLVDAIKIYEGILEKEPNHLESLFWLGFLYEENGQRQKAIEIWKQGLVVNDYYAPILNSLGYVYAELGLNLSEAEEMIKKALEIEPENGAYIDSLGWVYYKKGELAKAKEQLTKAISVAKDPDIYDHLGDLFIAMNQREKAVNWYRQGLNFFPKNQKLQLKIEKHERKNQTIKE